MINEKFLERFWVFPSSLFFLAHDGEFGMRPIFRRKLDLSLPPSISLSLHLYPPHVWYLAPHHELLALLTSLREASRRNLLRLRVEGDSSWTIQWDSGKANPLWQLADTFEEVKELSIRLRASFNHINRSANGEADHLAKEGIDWEARLDPSTSAMSSWFLVFFQSCIGAFFLFYFFCMTCFCWWVFFWFTIVPLYYTESVTPLFLNGFLSIFHKKIKK